MSNMRLIIVIYYFFYAILSICNIGDALINERRPISTAIGAFREPVTDFRPAYPSTRRHRRHGAAVGVRKADVLECIQRCRRLLDRSLLRIGLTATAVTAEYDSRLPESASAAAAMDAAPATNEATGEGQAKEASIRNSKYFNDVCWKYFDYSDCIKQCETSASPAADAANPPMGVSALRQRSLHKRRMEAIVTSLLATGGGSGDRTFFLATNALLKDCRANTPPETMSQFRCIHRYHTFLDVQCSSYAHEALRLVREQAGNAEAERPKRRSLSSKAAEMDADAEENAERKPQVVVNEEICRFLHYHSMCLANSVVQFCPSTSAAPQQTAAPQESDSVEERDSSAERRRNVGGSDPERNGAASLFNRFTLRDYFLSFVLPLRDQERYFTDRVLDECQLYDFQKIAKDIYASTKSSSERIVLLAGRRSTTKGGADGWRSTTVKRRSLFDLFSSGKEHSDGSDVTPPMETDTLRSTLFSSYEDLTDTPPNFYYSSAKYSTHLLTYYTNHQATRTTPQSFALLDGENRDVAADRRTSSPPSTDVEPSSEVKDERADTSSDSGDDDERLPPMSSSTVVVTFPDRHPQVDWTSANSPRGASKKTVELHNFFRYNTTVSATTAPNVRWSPRAEDNVGGGRRVTSAADDVESRRQAAGDSLRDDDDDDDVEEALPTDEPRVATERNGNDPSIHSSTWPDGGSTADSSRNVVDAWLPPTALTFPGPELVSLRPENGAVAAVESAAVEPSFTGDSAGERGDRSSAGASSPKFVIFHGYSEEDEENDGASFSDGTTEDDDGSDAVITTPQRSGKPKSFTWSAASLPPRRVDGRVDDGVGSPDPTPLLPLNSRVHVKKIVRFTESSRAADSDAEAASPDSAEYLDRPGGGRRRGGGGADGSRSRFPDDSYPAYYDHRDKWDYDGDYDAYYNSREYTSAADVGDSVTPSSWTTVYDDRRRPTSTEDGGEVQLLDENEHDPNDDRYYYEPYEISTASVTADEKTFYASIGKNPPPSPQGTDAREQQNRRFPTTSTERYPTRRFGNNQQFQTTPYDDDTITTGNGVRQQWRPDTALILLGLYFAFFTLVALALFCVGAAYAWRRLRWSRMKSSSLISSIMGGSLCTPHERL